MSIKQKKPRKGFTIKKKHFLLLVTLLFISSICFSSTSLAQGIEKKYYNNIEWMKNASFDLPISPNWYSNRTGDETDVNTSTSPGQANFNVLGERQTYMLAEDPPKMYNGWSMVENPEFPVLPSNPRNTSKGFEVYHNFRENATQMTSAHWTKEIDMEKDMSDYIIIDASLNVTVNGTVRGNSGTYLGYYGVEAVGDHTDTGNAGPPTVNPQFSTYDYVRYYALISDPSYENVFEIAYNQTTTLGKDNLTAGYTTLTHDYMTNTTLVQIPKESLIFFLTSVLAEDNQRFNLTLGMRIWCEDNFLNDGDLWESLVINSYSFSFTYEKKMDQFTTASWSQMGNQIPTENITITNGFVNYKYKINQSWTENSPNSELILLINGDSLNETIKLSTATLEWQNASIGFNVTSLLRQGVNISLSIQLSIADEFSLHHGIQISIDDVQLWISYVEEVYVQLPPPPSPPPIGLFIILGATGGVLITGFVLYETVLKYPAKVRNIRSLRRKVRRGTSSNPIHSKNSQSLSKNIYETEKSHLDRSMKSPASKAKSPSSTSTEKVSKSYEDPAKITKPELTKQVEKIKKPEGEQ